MSKLAISFDNLETKTKLAQKRVRSITIGLIVLLGLTTLLLLYSKPSNLYIIVIDISNSMSEPMKDEYGISRLDLAKDAMKQFVTHSSGNDFFLVATFGPGNCGGKGLDWVIKNPENCGGELIVDLVNDRNLVCSQLSQIESVNSETHLSEAIYKVFNSLEQNLPNFPSFKNIIMIIVGDGQDHCRAIESGNNVVTQPWSFYEILKTYVIATQVSDEEATLNLNTIAEDGNGEYIDIYHSDELTNKLNEIASRTPIWILFIHLGILVFISLIFLIILKT